MKKLTQVLLVLTILIIGLPAMASPLIASYTPTLTDLYLLYANPKAAAAVLGAILAAILLFYGVIWFYVTYIKKK